MAIDTKAKRYSMLNWASGPSIVKPAFDPDASVDAGDRYHVLNLYSGISLGAPVEEEDGDNPMMMPIMSNITSNIMSNIMVD